MVVYDFWHNTTKNEEYRCLVATKVKMASIANEQLLIFLKLTIMNGYGQRNGTLNIFNFFLVYS
jgi:hypothetical protein